MTKRAQLGVFSLAAVLVLTVVVVVTQNVDPTGHATGGGLAPSDGLTEVVFHLSDHVTVHPSPGAVDIPPAWDGNEVPQPPAPPEGYPSGPVITVQSQDGDLEIAEARVMVDGTDEAVAATVLRFGEDPKLPRGTVGLIPHKPLAELTRYRAIFTDTEGEVVADWPFTTASSVCDPTAQDCGRGQGCYLVEGKPLCIWAGVKRLGEPCAFLNACGPGLTCGRGRCQAYCDSSESADPDVACKNQCPQGGADITGSEDSPAKICLPANCLLEHMTCPEGEACYRFNELYICAEAGQVPPEGACKHANDCAPGSTCIGLNGTFACRTLCDTPGLPVCDTVCPGGYRTILDAPVVRHCR